MGRLFMSYHYDDYVKRSVSAKDLVFDKPGESDKEVIKQIKKNHIRTNLVFLIVLILLFLPFTWFFINFFFTPVNSIIYQIVTQAVLGFICFGLGYLIYTIVGPITRIRKGVVLGSTRIQEVKDNRNASYQYVFDIYFEDRDETLMAFAVDKYVFADVKPGDGVVVTKLGRKIRVYADPAREGVMDVSNIKSGV